MIAIDIFSVETVIEYNIDKWLIPILIICIFIDFGLS